jgi:hypothetical protein
VIFSVALLALVLTMPQQARDHDIDNANSVDHLCGKLVSSTPHPVKGRHYVGSVDQSSLGKTELTLFSRDADAVCCMNLKTAAKTTTGDDGAFEFKGVKSGSYWLVARSDGKDYKMAIRYEAKENPNDRCSDLRYEIEDAGLFELGRMISPTH